MESNIGETLTYHGTGERIDAWLTSKFSYSRNFFHRIIERGGIKVIPKVSSSQTHQIVLKVKKSYKLKDGDVVQIESLERFIDGGILEEAPELEITLTPNPSPSERGLSIYLEKKDYMVIYKPKGVLSHPNSIWDISHPSVVGGLYHYMKSNKPQARSGKQNVQSLPSMGSFIRAGLIHRLDKETDGLMIIAKTEKGLAYFKNLFQQKSGCESIEEKEKVPLKKYYRAVCDITEQGRIFLDSLEGNLPYIIDELVKAKVPHVKEYKRGITKILGYCHTDEVMSCRRMPVSQDGTCLSGDTETSSVGHLEVDLEILTGRTHQIRYHLSEKGLPIIGDYLYNPGYKEGKKTSMQLTAWKLEFLDCDGEKVVVEL